MVLFGLILAAIGQLDVKGWVETRPYLAWNDSVNIYGHNRGWLEFKADWENAGVQIGLDCLVPYDTVSFAGMQERVDISRLAVWLGPEHLRVIAGKQRLYWGVGRVFRALDVFNPVSFLEPSYERPGSNAVLGYVALGGMTSVRGICLPSYDLGQCFWGSRLGTNLFENDIGVSLMHKSAEEMTITGLEVAGDLIVGYWNELSYTWDDTAQYARATLGIDYTFPAMIYTMMELFYDGSGEDDPDNYDFTRITSGERMTLAQQYLYLSIGVIPNPFLRPSFSSVINLNDRGLVLIPQIYYSVFENAELTLGLNYFLGSDASEFRNLSPYEGQVYIWSRVYF